VPGGPGHELPLGIGTGQLEDGMQAGGDSGDVQSLAAQSSGRAVADTHVPDRAYQAVAAEFSQQEVAALVSLIVTINAWNAIGVSTRAWVPGTYQA
jgi:alkylhydroperoxidase family enzyme